jgi:nickel-dependent lactate racemase
MLIGKGLTDGFLSNEDISALVNRAFETWDLSGLKVLAIVPDSTRVVPVPLFFRLFQDALSGIVKSLDFIVASGTHLPMSNTGLFSHFGTAPRELSRKFSKTRLFSHQWNLPEELTLLGTIPADDISMLSSGLIQTELPVRINRLIQDYDILIVLSPVTPHEYTGFSGGNKSFFPGIGGHEVTNFIHWAGILPPQGNSIGDTRSPTRFLLDRAASLIPVPRLFFCPVLKNYGLSGLFIGDHNEAWEEAVKLSSKVHIIHEKRQYSTVVTKVPVMYQDMWTGAKCVTKNERIVEDDGELIVYAPHIGQLSFSHGMLIEALGYHTKDYFISHWEKFKGYPWMVLAHSTLLKPGGTYEQAKEKPRIRVRLATGIKRNICKKVNIDYANPDSIRLDDYINKEAQGFLLIHDGSEMLHQYNS